MKLRALSSAAACLTAAAALSAPQIARADDHLPIIDLQPLATFAGAGQARGTPASPLQNGNINLAGSVTIPVFKGFSLAYDRIVNGVYNNTFDQVIIPGVGVV
jgi:hypothetical protein